MEVTRVAYFLIIAVVGLLVAATIFLGGIETSRPAFPAAPSLVVSAGQPQISKISPDFCRTTTLGYYSQCELPLRIYNMRVRSNYTGEVAVVVSYKGQEWLIPCGSGVNRAGPCRLTGAETSLDLELDLSDFVSSEEGRLEPPTLNLSSESSYKAWFPHNQRLILGNYELFVKTVSVSAALFTIVEKALITVECKSKGLLGKESKIIALEKEKSTVIGLCGGSVSLGLRDIDDDRKESCLDIGVNGGNPWAGSGDLIKVTFWKYSPEFRGEQDLNPCGGLPQEFLQSYDYFDKFRFVTEHALKTPKCLNAFLGSIDLEAEILSYNPSTSTFKLRACEA